MSRKKLQQQIIVIGLALSFVAGCSAPAASVPTITPIPPTATYTPTPIPPTATNTKSADIYKSDDLGVTFEYPSGWYVSTPDQGFIEIASNEFVHPMQTGYQKNDVVIEIIGVPPDLHAAGNSEAAVVTLDQYTLFMGINNPDKEEGHIVNLNGNKFIVGTYSEDYIKETNGTAPLFIAIYFTKQNTLIVDMYALPDDESQLRKVFEDLLMSIKDLL